MMRITSSSSCSRHVWVTKITTTPPTKPKVCQRSSDPYSAIACSIPAAVQTLDLARAALRVPPSKSASTGSGSCPDGQPRHLPSRSTVLLAVFDNFANFGSKGGFDLHCFSVRNTKILVDIRYTLISVRDSETLYGKPHFGRDPDFRH